MLNCHATLTLTGEGSIVFVQPFPITHAMGQAIAPSLAGGFQLGAGIPPVTEFITAETTGPLGRRPACHPRTAFPRVRARSNEAGFQEAVRKDGVILPLDARA